MATTMLALAVLATGSGVIASLIGYRHYDSHTSFPPCSVRGTADYPYVIADIVQSTQIRTDGDVVIAENRHVYALWIRGTFRSPGHDFREWYEATKNDRNRTSDITVGSNALWTPTLRSGNWREGAISTDQDYPVYVQGELGSTVLVTSGADYRMPLPIPRRPLFRVGENQDFWSYRNREGDTICRITFVVTARDVPLTLLSVEEMFGDVVVNTAPSIDIASTSPQGHAEYTLRVTWATPLKPGHTRTVRYRLNPPPKE